jgi:hypothetical protein
MKKLAVNVRFECRAVGIAARTWNEIQGVGLTPLDMNLQFSSNSLSRILSNGVYPTPLFPSVAVKFWEGWIQVPNTVEIK